MEGCPITAARPAAARLLGQATAGIGEVGEERRQVTRRMQEAQDLRRHRPRVVDQDIGE